MPESSSSSTLCLRRHHSHTAVALLMTLLAFGTSSLSTMQCSAFAPPPAQRLAAPPLNLSIKNQLLHRATSSRSSRSSPSCLKAFALDGAASAVENFFISQPYMSAFLTCSFKASAADWVAQTTAATTPDSQDSQEQTPPQENGVASPVRMTSDDTFSGASSDSLNDDKNNDSSTPPMVLDLSRNVAFLLYGGLYQGMAQQFIYNSLFPDLFGTDTSSILSLTYQVAFDMLIVGPFLCLPVAYAVKCLFSSTASGDTDGDQRSVVQRLFDDEDNNNKDNKLSMILDALQHQGLDKYVEDVTTRGLLFKFWALWTPVQYLTFGVIPPHFRVAFIAFISFFWVCILSSVASSTTAEQELPSAAAAATSSEAQVRNNTSGGGGWGRGSFTRPLAPTPTAQQQQQAQP